MGGRYPSKGNNVAQRGCKRTAGYVANFGSVGGSHHIAVAGRAAAIVCWYSNGDNAVYPPAAATLDGADNRFIAGVAHVEMAFDARVLDDCLALLQAP